MSDCSECKEEKSNHIIINTTEYALSTYLVYKESGTNKCIMCWMKGNKIGGVRK